MAIPQLTPLNMEHSENLGQHRYTTTTRIAWGAVFAGTLVSLGCAGLLNFLGIGLTSFNLENANILILGEGATVWLAISSLLSMGIGGWFVGNLSNISGAFKRAYHGVIAWSLASILTVMLASGASGAFMGSLLNIISGHRYEVSKPAPSSTGAEVIFHLFEQTSAKIGQPDNSQIKSYTNEVGKAAIAVFMAFFLSGIASILGAVYGGKTNKDD